MKQVQFGQVAVIIALILIFISAIGGLYIFSQEKFDLKLPQKEASNQNVTPTAKVNVAPESSIRYRNLIVMKGLYSFNYPENWEVDGSEYSVSLIKIENDIGQPQMELSFSSDLERTIDTYNGGHSGVDVRFGSNNFKQSTNLALSNQRFDLYHIQIPTANDIKPGITVMVSKDAQIPSGVLKEILSSIKIDPTKLNQTPEAKTVEQNTAAMNSAQIRAVLNQFSASSELYIDANQYSYAGICNKTNSVAIKSGISQTITMIEGMVKASDIYCNSSAQAFVFAAPDSATSYYCIDSTGYRSTQTTKPGVLACK